MGVWWVVAGGELYGLGRVKWATLAHLRSVSDVVDFLQGPVVSDSEAGPSYGIGWDLYVNAPNDGPCLVVGLRGSVGTLEWWEACGNVGYVPKGCEKRGIEVEYWWLGEPVPVSVGEEVSIEYVWAAVGEFVATGKRPTLISWIDREDVPDYRPKVRLSDHPGFQKFQLKNPESAAHILHNLGNDYVPLTQTQDASRRGGSV